MKKVAIYARKSVEVQDSVSIETQVTMCKNYFADEECEFEIFKDDGYSGSNTNRPAFKLLRGKIELEMYNSLICYKLDRISRKVLDMADFFELLEKKSVDFVCVKDKYDTTTPMGRAMMYFASVFAQLERETIAERVRDSMLQLAKKGCWTGGPAPNGYKMIKRNGKTYLQLDNKALIEDCFNLYLENHSIQGTHKIIKNKYGYPIAPSSIRYILTNVIYVKSSEIVNEYLTKNGIQVVGETNGCGYLRYGNKSKDKTIAIVSTHQAVIEGAVWIKVQNTIHGNARAAAARQSKVYWLSSILKCPYCGNRYVITNSDNGTYYACANRIDRHHVLKQRCKNNKYVNAVKIENVVEKYIMKLTDKKIFDELYNKSHINKIPSNINELNSRISKNKKAIDNLIDKTSLLNNDAAKILIDRINKLSEENKHLTDQLNNEKLNVLRIESSKFDKSYVYENILNFRNAQDLQDKRNSANNIFKSIIYDPFKKSLIVNFL